MLSHSEKRNKDLCKRHISQPLSVVFSPRRAKKRPAKEEKYHAAGSPELVEGQAKSNACVSPGNMCAGGYAARALPRTKCIKGDPNATESHSRRRYRHRRCGRADDGRALARSRTDRRDHR